MKKVYYLLFVLLTVSAGAVSAQDYSTFRNPDREFNYGFITVSGGALVYYGDLTSHREFGDRIAPIMDVSLGKMFNPYIGARLQWSGWNAYGVAVEGARFQGGLLRDHDNLYKNDFFLNYTHVDLLWNLSNSVGGPKESRFWDFVPYIGVGWVNACKDGARPSNRFGANVGILQQMRLSPAVDILLDVHLMGTHKNTDGIVTGKHDIDMALSASLGLAYNFGRAQNSVVVAPIDVSAYENRINALERDLAASQSRADRLAAELEAERAKDKVVNNVHVASDLAVWFQINKANLTEKEKINLAYIADAIKKGPSDKVYTIFGSADKETGNPTINRRLSEQRAQVVYDELVKNGVNANQLRMNPVGDTQAEFDKPVLNRVAIVQQ
ncbi:MAG: OmpA family protein [Rikenellaceae bacterium]|nr:OmpA family protein [Rikenellaceae bacterium]